MHKRIANTVSLLVLLVTVGLAAEPTHAQGTQHDETDIAFAKRMAARLERVEKQADKLEDMIKEMSKQASRDELTQQDPFGQQSGIPRSDPQSDHRRAGMRMRSTRKKAEKEREKLVDLLRSGSSIEATDRERIEATVSNLERSVADMEHDIRLRRF